MTTTAWTVSLPIRRPPMTSNDQRRAHWTTVRQAKSVVALLVEHHARQVPQIDSCTVEVVWWAPDARRRDSDSLGPFLKAALDALVACGVLRDDCPPHVLATTTRVAIDRTNPRIEIKLTQEAPE